MSEELKRLKKSYQNRDRVVRALTEDTALRIAVVQNTRTVQTAQQRHGLSPLAAVFLGRALSGASLLASFLEGEERVSVEAMGNGVVGRVFAEAMQVGEARGYVEHPNASLDFGRENAGLRDGLGIGLLRVSKVLYHHREPVVGVVDLQEGDISTDIANYLIQSEQIRSAVLLDVDIDQDGKVAHSGGLLVQAMPKVDDERVEQVEQNIRELRNLTELWSTGYKPEEVVRMVADSPVNIASSSPIDFFCRCSIDRFKSALVTLGMDELSDMHAKDQRKLVCQYCNERYQLSDEDFDELFESLKTGR